MNYNDEIISFLTTTLSGWDVTCYHSRSLFIIKKRHNFGHNLHAGLFLCGRLDRIRRVKFLPWGLQNDRMQLSRRNIPLLPIGRPRFTRPFKGTTKIRTNSYGVKRAASLTYRQSGGLKNLRYHPPEFSGRCRWYLSLTFWSRFKKVWYLNSAICSTPTNKRLHKLLLWKFNVKICYFPDLTWYIGRLLILRIFWRHFHYGWRVHILDHRRQHLIK